MGVIGNYPIQRPPCLQTTTIDMLHTAGVNSPALTREAVERVEHVVATAQRYGRVSRDLGQDQLLKIKATVVEAYATVDKVFGIQAALEWANGFRFPAEAHTRDADQLRAAGYNLDALIAARQEALRPQRLNHSRLDKWNPSDPDLERLRSLVEGIHIPEDPAFVPPEDPPKVPSSQAQASGAISLMWYELYQQGLVLLIPTAELRKVKVEAPSASPVGYYPAQWVPKFGKRQGRPVSHYSYDNGKGGRLNTEFVRAAVEAFYGPIAPPTIEDLMAMVIAQADRYGWDGIILWKMDLKGAFNLLFFRPKDCGILTHELSDGLSVVTMVGNFGFTGTPYAFDVVSRAIQRRAQELMGDMGEVHIYVDDLMGCCRLGREEQCVACARQAVHELLGPDITGNNLAGPDSVNEDKTVRSRHLDFIGWSVDLETRRLGMARHNYLKTLYGFLQVEPKSVLKVRDYQKLGSWSSRYSKVCRFMRPFSYHLHQAYSGYQNPEVRLRITPEVWEVVSLWQMFLVMMALDPTRYTRDIESFRNPVPILFCNGDASLTGVGMIIYKWGPDRTAGPGREDVIAVVGYDTPYQLGGDSGFQNAMEFIGTVVLLAVLVSRGYRKGGLHLQGDNTTSLSWSRLENFRGRYTQVASVVFILLSMESGLEVGETEHMPGILMIDQSDPLSRGTSPVDLGFQPAVVLKIENNPTLARLIILMDPSRVPSLACGLDELWGELVGLVQILMSPRGGWV